MKKITEENQFVSEDNLDLSLYFKALKKRWFLILLFAILMTGITILIVLSITPKYTATATLLIEAQQKKVVSIEDVVGIDSTQAEYYLTQFEILKSNQIAEKVIDDLKLQEKSEFNEFLNNKKSVMDYIRGIALFKSLLPDPSDEEPTQETVRQSVLFNFKSNLVVSPINKTQLVKISFTSQDPELAAKIANAVGYAYIDINLEARITATQYASSWISERLAELTSQLESSEQALSDFLVREKLIDDSGIDALASQELANLTQRLSNVRDRRIEVESAYSALRSSDGTNISSLSSIPIISSHPQVIAIRAAEIEAKNEVELLSKRYGPRHDQMKLATARLQSVQDQASNITRELINGIGKELQAVRKQESLIQSEIDARKGEFQDITVKKSQYEALKREVETNRSVLNVFLTRQKETTATGDFDSANARFTDEALVPQIPASPKKKVIVVLAFVVSFGFAVIMVLITAGMKNTIESVGDFENKFGLIPLGGIPKIKSKLFKKQPLDNNVFFDESQVQFSESFRSIRTSLMLAFLNKENKRLAVASSLPQEGKTTIAINLAMSFAKVESVILVDCDLRKPSVAERFGKKRFQQGLTNHLLMGVDIQDCLFKDQQSGLTILPAGMLTPNPQELLGSKKFEELLNLLESKFDRIIIDTPPTLPVSDSLLVSQLTKAVLFVVKANDTKQESVKKAMSKLISHNIMIDGVVVNQMNMKTVQNEYGYGEYVSYGNTVTEK